MARILIHALAATAGGGANYLRNLLARLPREGAAHQWDVLMPPNMADGFEAADNVQPLRLTPSGGAVGRVWFDQLGLGALIRRRRVDLLLATGNFGMVRPPVPQMLLNRNALYFSTDHTRELRRRRDWRELASTLLRRRMALASIRASELNITPTQAFADEIRQWAVGIPDDRFRVIAHGFDHGGFSRPGKELDPALAAKLRSEPGVRRIMLVSHYNYFRNFETLLRAFALLRQRSAEPLELVLTTRLGDGVRDHRYDTTMAFRLMCDLGIADRVTMLGQVPHGEINPLLRLADVVVCASYAESFGHPMVEAMASGRPVAASDRSLHREVCNAAALYFDTFSPEALADCLHRLLGDPSLAQRLGEAGLTRAKDFCWTKHARELSAAIDDVLARSTQPRRTHAWMASN